MPDSPRSEGQSSDTPTRLAARDPDPAGARAGSRFVPGTLFDRRYRVIGLLGRGGMGEVYRADDLKLGEPVALKFLPPGLERDDQRLRLLLDEVRTARQVSHPHVCRVHDVGEVEGQHFLSMEFVDGEDLGSLLRRIGRLQRDKAIEVARQMCAGLAAAHERGVLHRDLKPANVMLDGRGRVRLTDFGLAVMAADRQGRGEESRAGTPLYMAPEQREGREATVRSDIYSLGLVLHELFTGRLPVGPTSPTGSSHVEGLEPAVEEVILRCLNADPALRPASALAVAAALPGFDPIAAALAAGETPSPQMVAAAGGSGALTPASAWSLLAAAAGLLITIPLLAAGLGPSPEGPPPKPPDALVDQAREILVKAGQEGLVLDEAWGFQPASGGSTSLPPMTLRFWYRSSPEYLSSQSRSWQVTPTEPPLTLAGMTVIRLDRQGRLLELQVVPPAVGNPASLPQEPDWQALFTAAGLDSGRFTAAEPARVPPAFADSRTAWVGGAQGRAETLLRVEAAAFQGRPVSFLVSDSVLGSEPERNEGEDSLRLGNTLFSIFTLIALVGGAILARRNTRLGRGDKVGAIRVAVYFLVTHVVVWFLIAHHVPIFLEETEALWMAVAISLFEAGLLWLLYVALEPYVRRNWPNTLIAWSRLLGGGVRNPLVGRDVLIGITWGGAVFLLMLLARRAGWVVSIPGPPSVYFSDLLGLRWSLGHLLDRIAHSIIDTTLFLFLFMMLRIVLRKTWLAGAAFAGVASLLGVSVTGGSPAGVAVVIAMFALQAVLMVRFGLLSAIASGLVYTSLAQSPMTWGEPSWSNSAVVLPILCAGVLAISGFRIALAGQPVFGGAALDE